MERVKKLMSAGDFARAAERLRDRLTACPGDEQAKLMLGACLHVLGDDDAFVRIDDELSRSSTARRLPAWPKFHALRAAACGGALLLAGVIGDAQAEVSHTLYGGPPIDHRQLVVPTPTASDGRYSGYVRLTWKAVAGADHYKIRRATSRDFSKSKVIATVYGTSYKDRHPAKRPRKKYHYWVVPYVWTGQGRKDAGRSDSGYARQLLRLEPSSGVVTAGSVWRFSVSGNNGQSMAPADCRWRIVSGGDCATISRSGRLKAKKEGVVEVEAAYNGATARSTIQIVNVLYTLYGGPPAPVLVTTKYGGPPITPLKKVSR